MNRLLSIALTLLVSACAVEQEESTRRMAEKLDELYQLSFTNVNYPYHNSAKADLLSKQLKGNP